MDDQRLGGGAEFVGFGTQLFEVLAQINTQHGQVHLVTGDHKRQFVLDQPFTVVSGDSCPHIHDLSTPFGLYLAHVLADGCR